MRNNPEMSREFALASMAAKYGEPAAAMIAMISETMLCIVGGVEQAGSKGVDRAEIDEHLATEHSCPANHRQALLDAMVAIGCLSRTSVQIDGEPTMERYHFVKSIFDRATEEGNAKLPFVAYKQALESQSQVNQ